MNAPAGWLACLAVLLGCATGPAAAENIPARLQLLSNVDQMGERTGVVLGLRLRPEPGWKIYAPSTLPSGIPPELDWQGSANLLRATPHWPCPRRYDVDGSAVLAYATETLVPIMLQLHDQRRPADLRLTVSFAICQDVCILADVEMRLLLPAGPERRSADAPRIEQAMAARPAAGCPAS